ncbi:Dynein_light chain LC8 [Hexamita inflata]|uniref:Dynein light chain n=1 Tax=Hexamita inflata TaxID=28002 RepID=A0AA86Q4N7_9EUKA|nr:Dynein light chain LC8 [Hexamita inflata]CAI9950466.1 Dynein light chain LC8 [Hexamita inflata]CAI9960724.1 Dynein light chain LC8 [Hexamita inflata]
MSQNDQNQARLQQEQTDQLRDIMSVTSTDFPDDQKKVIIQIVAQAIFKCNTEKEISYNIKKQMDAQFNDHFNAIVGRHFGANLTSTVERFIYLQVGTLQVLIFKSQC